MDALLIDLVNFLHYRSASLSQVLEHVLYRGHREGTGATDFLLREILQSSYRIIHALCRHQEPYHWILLINEQTYIAELQQLVKKENGWHFSAVRAREDQIENFELDKMAMKQREVAPRLWRLLTALTHANSGDPSIEGPDEWDEEDVYIADLEGLEEEALMGRDDTVDKGRVRASELTIRERRETLKRIVSRERDGSARRVAK